MQVEPSRFRALVHEVPVSVVANYIIRKRRLSFPQISLNGYAMGISVSNYVKAP